MWPAHKMIRGTSAMKATSAQHNATFHCSHTIFEHKIAISAMSVSRRSKSPAEKKGTKLD